jgi:hypothetical protein
MSTGKWSGDTNHWHNKRLARQKQLFLKGLAERGTVRAASEVCGIDGKTAYRWRAADEEFSRAWDSARETATDAVESALYELAKSGKNVIATIFWMKAHRVQYRDRLNIDMNKLDHDIEQGIRRLEAQGYKIRILGKGIFDIQNPPPGWKPPQQQLTDGNSPESYIDAHEVSSNDNHND